MTNIILNLTQHNATPEQQAEGVVEPHNKEEIQKLLTFDTIPAVWEINYAAARLVNIARNFFLNKESLHYAMIGGAPYLMSALEKELKAVGIIPLYSFSKRESIEEVVGGKVIKKSVFVHVGFVGLPTPCPDCGADTSQDASWECSHCGNV